MSNNKRFRIKLSWGFVIGLGLFFGLNSMTGSGLLGLDDHAWRALAVSGLMLALWVTEAAPIPAVSLLPIVLFPMLGVMGLEESATPYANSVVFLFMGGFMLALAIEKWKLHLRIALNIMRLTGTNANGILLGFMLATAFLSMWISNTATTVMMLPIASSIVALVLKDGKGDFTAKGQAHFALVMMLGVAYSANIGGMATIIGTPPNTVLAGILQKNHGIELSFADWMAVGLPFVVIMLLLTYALLVYVVYPNRIGNYEGGKELIDRELDKLGAMTVGEKRTLAVFVVTALLWIFRQQLADFSPFFKPLSDPVIAIAASFALFSLPSGERKGALLDWKDTTSLPWGILLLFGGGLSLAAALAKTGIIDLVGQYFSDKPGGMFWMVFGLTAISLFLTEVMSNVALVTVLVPVVAALGVSWDENLVLMTVPVTLASSCAFMLPMSTPPNAIVFASGYIKIPQMAKAGLWLNILAVLLIMLFYKTLMAWVWG